MNADRRSERQRRRKIPLACEPCRERKSRCDGAKPICSTCQRRSLPLHQCIYTLDNARTASNDAYIKVLHDRIRLLESTCTEHGIPTPPLDSGAGERLAPPAHPRDSLSLRERQSGTTLPTPDPARRSLSENGASPVPRHTLGAVSPVCERLDATESVASVTAMGTVLTEGDACQAFEAANEFYGSSSAASFMKEACISVKPHKSPGSDANTQPTRLPTFMMNFGRSEGLGHAQLAQPDKFSLPPRNLADHLLNQYWQKVYWLYPFFHKPTFLRAYESLWRPADEQAPGAALPGLGLGCSPGADTGTIVFYSALNTIFALGCQTADLSPKDKASAIETFFHRAKEFVGLDFLDMHNVGVVQALLLMTLLLQSTPFPSRCWNAIGVACRVAQGLGLHTESDRTPRPPLEVEIRRRTWHGCVVLDMIVSMTYGRPTTTAHLPELVLPSTEEFDNETQGEAQLASQTVPSKMHFYVDFIRQCRILGEVLSSVYQISHSPSSSSDEPKSRGMDSILELDAKLSRYENALDPIMSWKSPSDISALGDERQLVIVTQRTVLRGAFLYLRLMLHRPILTRLCAEAHPNANSEPSSPTRPDPLPASQELFNSFAAGCARICLGAAMDLIEQVHSTYLTNVTCGWWWSGLYAFTGGLAVIVAYLCPPLIASLDRRRLENCWMHCQTVLTHFSSFSISAHRSLKLLQKVHADVMSRVSSDYPAASRPGAMPLAVMENGEGVSIGQELGAAHPHETPLDLGGNFQWQITGGAEFDLFDGRSLFNWDQSLDMIAGGLGMGV